MKRMKLKQTTGITFYEGCEKYLLDCQNRNLRKGTVNHYRDSINQLIKYIPSETEASEITQETINQTMKDMLNTGMKEISMYTYLRDLKTILYFLMNCNLIDYYRIKLPKVEKEPIETYTDNELALLLKKPNLNKSTFSEYRMWVIINFLLSTGIRRGSLINIKIKDIDFDNCIAHINFTKTRKILLIPLNKDIVNILREYLKYRDGKDDDYLFCNVYGKQLSTSAVNHAMLIYHNSRHVSTCGMHRYRHTFAKKFILLGGNVVTLQKILGHSSLAITQNYINLLVSDIKNDVEEFNILSEFKHTTIKMK